MPAGLIVLAVQIVSVGLYVFAGLYVSAGLVVSDGLYVSAGLAVSTGQHVPRASMCQPAWLYQPDPNARACPIVLDC